MTCTPLPSQFHPFGDLWTPDKRALRHYTQRLHIGFRRVWSPFLLEAGCPLQKVGAIGEGVTELSFSFVSGLEQPPCGGDGRRPVASAKSLGRFAVNDLRGRRAHRVFRLTDLTPHDKNYALTSD